MNELIDARTSYGDFRLHLLATAAMTFLYLSGTSQAQAEDASRPTVWIEVGGQLERAEGTQQPFLPPFTQAILDAGFPSPAIAERSPANSFGGDGKISIEPLNSDWILSASIRYGRSNAKRNSHQQTPGDPKNVYISFSGQRFLIFDSTVPPAVRFEDVTSDQIQTHAVLDFQVGKDVGLGMFGRNGTSVFGGGVRFAQITSRSNIAIHADPDFYFPSTLAIPLARHLYQASSENKRSFQGVGPSIYWHASAPFAGDQESGEVSFDWGLDASVLFGRQKLRESHNTYTLYNKQRQFPILRYPAVIHSNGGAYNRSRSVVVPNVGGFAGISMRYSSAKISVGYRGDFFLGAVDGGLATRDAQTRSFYGPFATISIGLGQ